MPKISPADFIRNAGKTLGWDEAKITAAVADFSDPRAVDAFNTSFVDAAEHKTVLQRAEDQRAAELRKLQGEWNSFFTTEMAGAGQVKRLAALGYDVTGLEERSDGGVQDRGTGESMTRAEVETLMRETVAAIGSKVIEPMRAELVNYTTFLGKQAPWYAARYGKPLDTESFRKFAYENREKYADYDSALKAYAAADEDKYIADDRTKWEAQKTEEIRKQVMSEARHPDSGAPYATADRSHLFRTPEKSGESGAKPEVRPYSYSIDDHATVAVPTTAVVRDPEVKRSLALKYKDADFDLSNVGPAATTQH